jgi:hypothetical protein
MKDNKKEKTKPAPEKVPSKKYNTKLSIDASFEDVIKVAMSGNPVSKKIKK